MSRGCTSIIWVTSYLLFMHILHRCHGVNDRRKVIGGWMKTSDKKIRPLEDTGYPIQINVSLWITSINSQSDDTSDFRASMYIRKFWVDPRLHYDDGPEYINLGPDHAERFLWMPDLHVINAKDVSGSESGRDYGVRIKPDGEVLQSQRVNIRAECQMDLRRYPMDHQRCPLYIESYMHDIKDVDLSWNDIRLDSPDVPALFEIAQLENTSVPTSNGVYTKARLVLVVNMHRIRSRHLVMTFLPSGLLVLLACLLFWMPPHALLERTLFSVFLLLVFGTIMIAGLHGVPNVGYLKAIDVWLVGCFLFLLVASLEVISLLLLARASAASSTDNFELMADRTSSTSSVEVMNKPGLVAVAVRPDTVRRMDVALRVIYPLAFAVFNVVFWPIVI